MHYRFLVTFNKEAAKTSKEARQYAMSYLDDNDFANQQGRWSGSPADWYVIGGRWSGELSRHSWAKGLTVKMDKIEKEKDVRVWGVWYGDKKKQEVQRELAKQLQTMWDKEAPPAYRGIPVQRDTYQPDGHEDDAMLLTDELYNGLLKEYDGQDESECHADFEYDVVRSIRPFLRFS